MRIFLSFIVVIFGLLGGFYYFITQDYYVRSISKDKTPIIFEVSSGESFIEIARNLELKGLIDNQHLFNLVAKLKNLRSKVKAGEYQLTPSMTPKEILQVLISGKSILHTFTVSEGLNIYEVGLAYEKQGYGRKDLFLEACFDKELLKRILGEELYSCEGYLFPETYNIDKKTSASQLVEIMLKMFVKKYTESTQDLNLVGWTRHQIVTLASIIEKETGAKEERPIISSVFHNRLKKRMKLQTDPTVLYGILDQTKSYRANITKKDLTTPTPFNTYTNEGLPFGPVSNPGVEAVRAVFNPAETSYLFFVSKNDGTHVFSERYEDHSKSVTQFQIDKKAREGKSWRDLSDKKEDAVISISKEKKSGKDKTSATTKNKKTKK